MRRRRFRRPADAQRSLGQRKDVRLIAVALKADQAGGVFVGRTANEDQIKSLDRSGYKMLAFAMHGLLRRQFQ